MQEQIANWGIGINLGNSLDAIGGETAWGNPPVTREMIHMYAAAGFDMLRVPTTWAGHFGDAPDYPVNPAWMNRVQQVVDWALEEGLRVILNTHHEQNLWLRTELKTLRNVLPAFVALWKQVAARFAGYDDMLVFQGLNEPRVEGGAEEWNGATPDVRAAVNALNAAFVDVIRESGGQNARRWLCIPPVGAQITAPGLKDMIIPEDNRLIVTVHSYKPERFVLDHHAVGSVSVFGPDEEAELDSAFALLKDFRHAHPTVPLMITEHGAVSKVSGPLGQRNDMDRAKFEHAFLSRASAMGIPCVYWDNNYYSAGDEWFGLFDRVTLKCHSPRVLEAMLAYRTK